MPISRAQQKAVAKYVSTNYDDIKVRVPKGHRVMIKAHAQSRHETVNSFITRAIEETIQRDDGNGGE